jgi:hypothetical protein
MTAGRQDNASAGSPGPESQKAESQDWARDWATIWQSELNALLVDREAREMLGSLLALWASAGSGFLDLLAKAMPDGSAGRTAPAQPPRPQAAAAAPDAGRAGPDNGAEIERLRKRVAELERRLDEMEQGAGPSRPARPERRKTSRS